MLHIINQFSQQINALKQHIDDIRSGLSFFFSDFVKKRFQLVAQFADQLEIQKTGQALDGMDRPENVIDAFFIRKLAFQVQQFLIDIVEIFFGFCNKILG